MERLHAVLETKPDIPTYDLPGPKGAEVVAIENAIDTTGTKTAPIAVKHARGLMLEDVDGNVFLDFTSGMVTATGHCHPKIVQAINDQAQRYSTGNLRDVYFYPSQLKGHTERVYHPGERTGS